VSTVRMISMADYQKNCSQYEARIDYDIPHVGH